MSGIVGIVNIDGSPIDRRLLTSMVQYMAPRGPDAQEIWIDANVGFGHAMLRATDEAATEHQPFTIDGRTWITADCRVDAREDLLRELTSHGVSAHGKAPDPELILHAYHVWGEKCVDHLIGDFAFAIWDAQRKTLFCARDQFGIKPFYYARAGNALVVSNTFNCVRFHPSLSTRLDELSLADFLVYSYPLDTDRTIFAEIKRLPSAHVLTLTGDKVSVRRYWEIPVEEEIRYRRRGEYIEHFTELLDVAVGDRLRTRNVGVFMSGGLDSTSVAATAKKLLSASSEPFDLRAHTVVFDQNVRDEERKYSQLAADFIGIPIHHFASDGYWFPRDEPERSWFPAQPDSLIDRHRSIAIHGEPAAASRVLLRGDGADPLVEFQGPSLRRLLRRGRYASLTRDLAWLARTRRRIPRIGARTLIRSFWKKPEPDAVLPFPDWFAPRFAERLSLKQRWNGESEVSDPHPGFELSHGYWAYTFETFDLGNMQMPSEMRYPYMDVRMVRYLLRLPPIPWTVEKSIMRIAMKKCLPDKILTRPKTALAGTPWAFLIPPVQTGWWKPYLTAENGLDEFVDLIKVERAMTSIMAKSQANNEHSDSDLLRSSLRPISINLWLKHNYLTRFGNHSAPENDEK